MFFGRVFVLISLGLPHVLRAQMGGVTHRTRGTWLPNELDLTAAHGSLNGSCCHVTVTGHARHRAGPRLSRLTSPPWGSNSIPPAHLHARTPHGGASYVRMRGRHQRADERAKSRNTPTR